MKITPTRNHVFVELDEAETRTKGGVILPETASKEKPRMGKVVAVGQGAFDKKGKRIPMQVKVGDRVIFAEYAGNEYESEGKKSLILTENEILAVQ